MSRDETFWHTDDQKYFVEPASYHPLWPTRNATHTVAPGIASVLAPVVTVGGISNPHCTLSLIF